MKRAHRISTAGNAAIELALTFLLLWMLFGGAFRFGYSIYIYESLVSQVANAARYASRVDFDTGHTFVSAVQKMAVYGSPAGGLSALVPGLTTANINVTWTTDSTGLPLSMTVSLNNYTVNTLFQSFTWSGKPAFTVRFAGRYVT
jgi:Flp pilus assembly protein TadG